MEDVIRVHDTHYILATSALADDRTRVLKHGDTFVVLDRFGDIVPIGAGRLGLFHRGTRHLSHFALRMNGGRPLLLSSTVEHDNGALVANLTNPDRAVDGHVLLPRDTVFVERTSVLLDGDCYTRLLVRNFDLAPAAVTLDLRLDADFVDIFEVRGMQRARRGRLLAPVVGARSLVLAYEGLDDVVRRTDVAFDPAPESVKAEGARFAIELGAGEERILTCRVSCSTTPNGDRPHVARSFPDALRVARADQQRALADACSIRTSNARFDDWLARSATDLAMMLTPTPSGVVPYAGVPWFCAPFGRDAIWTALQLLWTAPSVASGVLRFLADTQATAVRPDVDAEPGKIVHEMREGEMAALGEVPFARYYGSVDATPLFVMLAAEYFARTGDHALLEGIWPNVLLALDWIDQYGDADRDGFVEYARRSERGLQQQGWKDSEDSVMHADGTLAEGPIALCEVQAYVYAAKRGAARLAAALGEVDRAQALIAQAWALRARFEDAFWCEPIGTYALALDGAKRPCRVRTSNAGHCLYAGIATPARAAAVASTLLGGDMFSGWGVRTLGAGERRYNPMSYHDGSVWPHDNGVVAAGLARYRRHDLVQQIFTGMFQASTAVDLSRLPELFCGFQRQTGVGPTLYPVACAPQAWASGTVYMLLASALGIEIDGVERRVRFAHTRLPPFLDRMWIEGLRVGDAVVALELRRYADDVGVVVTHRDGDVQVVAVK